MSSIDHNRQVWDRRVEEGLVFTRPATRQEIAQPDPLLDPWAKNEGVRGKRVLCLGAGGGRQGTLYAAAGAQVTVVDISEQQLVTDRAIAAEYKLDITAVRASIDDLSALPMRSFDMVIQPVSTCYVPDLAAVYRQVAGVIRPGGLYVSQHKQPTSLQAHIRPGTRGYELLEPYYRQGPLPEVRGSIHREPGTHEFLHRWEHLVGELCRTGFVLEDLSEPWHGDPAARPGEFGHRSTYVAPYVRLKARRTDAPPAPVKILSPVLP